MISINSLPPEVTEIIIRGTAASGDGNDDPHFKNQLTLTARISSNWTYASQMIMHSELEFHDGYQANEWLKCGIAGKFKTKSLNLSGFMEEVTVKKVMNKVLGLENLILGLFVIAFDMELLQGERFSNLKSFEWISHLSFVGYDRNPFEFQLSKLSLGRNSSCSLKLFSALTRNSKSSMKYLSILDQVLLARRQAILKLEDFPRIKSLHLAASSIATLAPLRELEIFHTSTGYDEAELDHLESILSTILPGQLKEFKIELDSGGQIEQEELESVERMMNLPGLSRLEKIRISYEGHELDGMARIKAEWESRGSDGVRVVRDIGSNTYEIESDFGFDDFDPTFPYEDDD